MKPVPLSEVNALEGSRIATGSEEFDRVLGGGAMKRSVILIGGEPGIGKSTLLIQTCAAVSKKSSNKALSASKMRLTGETSGKVLYVSGEESASQIKNRADRLSLDTSNIQILCTTRLEDISDALDELVPSLVIIDSIQTVSSIEAGNIPGTGVTAVYDAASHCLVIRDVAQGSPAAEVGLTAGNRISAVDQTAVTKTNSSQLINLLFAADKKNTTLELLETGADGKEARRLVTVRNGYTAQSCLTNTVGGVGYVVFTDFYPDTAARFDEALTAFTDKGVKSLVIDVRNCQSVNYEQAAQVIDRIVPMAGEGIGAIAAAVDKNGNTVRLFSSGSDQVNMTIAVLIFIIVLDYFVVRAFSHVLLHLLEDMRITLPDRTHIDLFVAVGVSDKGVDHYSRYDDKSEYYERHIYLAFQQPVSCFFDDIILYSGG